ncbi:hypothetical protein [Falsihalocynthiibacter arcticus]|uniref:Uncharacterized protein n=1 Tax=Falsihalocynthiibacter arcticus TaxID=1579316 RepID=A0A126UZP3_9RHOB|nr:hypothetical protein [Falsihalocynthiibacter arcticus]AML51541.1 hypothetical protein RC74_09955 [Falsihalocynthiibacter arcticus]
MTISSAHNLWLEAGDMSGGSRNQIEFSDDLIRFFDADSLQSGKVFIAYDSKVKAYCPLADRGTEYGQRVNIWRLGLITEDKGGQKYPGRVIHLEKKLIGKKYVYLIKVHDCASSDHHSLISKSTSTGLTGGTSGRRYGYW